MKFKIQITRHGLFIGKAIHRKSDFTGAEFTLWRGLAVTFGRYVGNHWVKWMPYFTRRWADEPCFTHVHID